ncbi:lysophospholipid acyltransferase family protein [Marinobacterium maritimum]
MLFVLLIAKPLVNLALGINLRQLEKLPRQGPYILAANHNSHLDVLVLLSLFPISAVHRVRPVAAADYFLSNPLRAWFSLHVLGIIPLQRTPDRKNLDTLFGQCSESLDKGEILIIFPEGSRGKPEVMGPIKKGIYRLLKDRQDCAVMPIMMRGLGRALPRGTARLVPFNCDVVIGQSMTELGDPAKFVSRLQADFDELSTYCLTSTLAEEE